MTRSEAAAYLGLTRASFSKWVADGRAPKPLHGTRRWDRKAIDLALDKLSGIVLPSVVPEDECPLEEWKREDEWERRYEARKAAGERDPEYIRKEAVREAAFAKRRGRRMRQELNRRGKPQSA